MTVFQIIAVPIAALFFLASVRRLLRGEQPRWFPLVSSMVWLAAAVALCIPQTTSSVAKLLGIGRGADLVAYLAVVLLLAACFYFYQKCRRLEADMTALVRALAIQGARDCRTLTPADDAPPTDDPAAARRAVPADLPERHA